jgi:hypothetical protein
LFCKKHYYLIRYLPFAASLASVIYLLFFNPMFLRFVSASLFGLSLAAIGLPAAARPEIATGDQWLNGVSQEECLSRTDSFIGELDVPVETGEIDRTGYFDDGVFRILCYRGGQESSMVLILSAHSESAEVATQFMQFALQEITGVTSGQTL